MPTGLQIRQRLADPRKAEGKPLLIVLGKTAAAGDSAGTYLVDTIRLQMPTHGSDYFGDAYVRVSDGSDAGFVGKVEFLDTANGRIYFSPAYGAAIDSASQYEVFLRGIRPDDYDRSRDFALTTKC